MQGATLSDRCARSACPPHGALHRDTLRNRVRPPHDQFSKSPGHSDPTPGRNFFELGRKNSQFLELLVKLGETGVTFMKFRQPPVGSCEAYVPCDSLVDRIIADFSNGRRTSPVWSLEICGSPAMVLFLHGKVQG